MNRQRYLPRGLARVGFAVTLTASLAAVGGCGEEPGDLADTGFASLEPKPDNLETTAQEPLQDESARVVDKQTFLDFIDPTLSCTSLPDRTCPGVTLRMANRSIVIFLGDSGGSVSVPLNPAPPVQEVFQSGEGMRAGLDLNSISCRYTGGQQVTFTEELQLRFNTETQFIAQSNGTALVSPPSPSSNLSRTLIFSEFLCPSSAIGVIAADFEPAVVQARGRFISARKGEPDDQLLRDGTAPFFIQCESTLNLDNVVIERERPRDLLAASGNQFVDALSLSPTERQQRCNNLCFNDCAVSFGVDALGAQNCTDVCTSGCVSRSTANNNSCPPQEPECKPCSQPSDCGGIPEFRCTSGCCFQPPS